MKKKSCGTLHLFDTLIIHQDKAKKRNHGKFGDGVDLQASIASPQSEQSQKVQSFEPEKALESIIGIGQADLR